MDIEQQVELLERLAALRATGSLTDREYEIERSRLLESQPCDYAERSRKRRTRNLIGGATAVAAIAIVTTAGAAHYFRAQSATSASGAAAQPLTHSSPVTETTADAPTAAADTQAPPAPPQPQLATLKVQCGSNYTSQKMNLIMCIDDTNLPSHLVVENDGVQSRYKFRNILGDGSSANAYFDGFTKPRFEAQVDPTDFRLSALVYNDSVFIDAQLIGADGAVLQSQKGYHVTMCAGSRYDTQCKEPLNRSAS